MLLIVECSFYYIKYILFDVMYVNKDIYNDLLKKLKFY